MKVCIISDLHGYLPKINPCELVLLAGDLVDLRYQSNFFKTKRWYENEFDNWGNSLPCDKVIFIAGNHELGIENHEKFFKNKFKDKIIFINNENIRYLSRDNIEYNIFGTPYCKIFYNWAFNRNDKELKELYSVMDDDTNIILSHDAPYGVSDVCFGKEEHLGNIPLRDIILDKKPEYCFHGHIHSSNHECEMLGDTKVYNCSYIDEQYKPFYKPLYLDI